MVKAVIRDGRIEPLGPLPPEWEDGREVFVETDPYDEMTPDEIAADFAELDRLCADNDPADEARMTAAIAEHRREAKEQARREMGL